MDSLIRQFLQRDATAPVQFVKYAISGALAVAVHTLAFYVCAWFFLPAIHQGDWVVKLLGLDAPELTDAVRARNAMLDNWIAFLFSNMVAYLVNICWVFKRGRHHWLVEIALFYLVSGISVLIGTFLMGALIRFFALSTTVAFGVVVVVSAMINYVVRKFVIFAG